MHTVADMLAQHGYQPEFPYQLAELACTTPIEPSHYLALLLRLRPYYSHIASKDRFLKPLREASKGIPANPLLLALIEADLAPTMYGRQRLRSLFRDYVHKHYPAMPLLAHPEVAKKYNSPDSQLSLDAGFSIKEWYTQLQLGAEALFCEECESPLMPYFGKTQDLYCCSNPDCGDPEESPVRYHNHCWSCHSTIDSEYHQRCSHCGWYICNACGHCKKSCEDKRSPQKRGVGTPRPLKVLRRMSDLPAQTFLDLYRDTAKTYQPFSSSAGVWNRESLERGRKILTSQDELRRYLFLYGGHHYYKLIDAFASTNLEQINRCTIIDWGCGQGTASHVLLDELTTRNLPLRIDRIILVEPSRVALECAAQRIRRHPYYASNCTLITINTDIDEVNLAPALGESTTYLHLFSNILDIESFSLKRLTAQISQTCYGKNTILCTGPNYSRARQRTDTFCNLLRAGHVIQHESRDDRALEADIYYWKKRKFCARQAHAALFVVRRGFAAPHHKQCFCGSGEAAPAPSPCMVLLPPTKKRKFVRDLITRYQRIMEVEFADASLQQRQAVSLFRQRRPTAPLTHN